MAWVAPAIQAGGAILGAISGGKGGGGPKAPKAPKWAGRLLDPASRMRVVASQSPASQAIAGFTPDQLRSMQMVRNSLGFGQGPLATAQNRVNALAQNGVTGADISKFMNPYMDQVVNATMADIDRSRQQRQLGISSEA